MGRKRGYESAQFGTRYRLRRKRFDEVIWRECEWGNTAARCERRLPGLTFFHPITSTAVTYNIIIEVPPEAWGPLSVAEARLVVVVNVIEEELLER